MTCAVTPSLICCDTCRDTLQGKDQLEGFKQLVQQIGKLEKGEGGQKLLVLKDGL